MVIHIKLDETKEHQLREYAMKKYGYKKGALTEAITEAITSWLEQQKLSNSSKIFAQENLNTYELSDFITILKKPGKVETSLDELKTERAILSKEAENEDLS